MSFMVSGSTDPVIWIAVSHLYVMSARLNKLYLAVAALLVSLLFDIELFHYLIFLQNTLGKW